MELEERGEENATKWRTWPQEVLAPQILREIKDDRPGPCPPLRSILFPPLLQFHLLQILPIVMNIYNISRRPSAWVIPCLVLPLDLECCLEICYSRGTTQKSRCNQFSPLHAMLLHSLASTLQGYAACILIIGFIRMLS